ncbi:hypothetical protein BGZ47_002397 [Haplosporangium gracile]|nr:hypothetical protein BGZ47_002397 [Haplosporangium gracile]
MLMQYREALLKRKPNGPVERLTTTHIYLFDRDDQSSTLIDTIDDIKLRAALSYDTTPLSSQDPTSMAEVIVDIIEISRTIPQFSHTDVPDYILDSKTDPQLKRLLLRLVETSHLWMGSVDGEFGGFEKTLWPFIKIYLSGITGTATLAVPIRYDEPGDCDRSYALAETRLSDGSERLLTQNFGRGSELVASVSRQASKDTVSSSVAASLERFSKRTRMLELLSMVGSQGRQS